MADGDPQRIALFKSLTDTWDKLQAAHQAKNADEEARLRIEYDKILASENRQRSDRRHQLFDRRSREHPQLAAGRPRQPCSLRSSRSTLLFPRVSRPSIST